jgi:hypothetical protein
MKEILGILLLCGCLAGCARGGSGSSLSGNWQFTVNSTASVLNFTLSGTLQEGSNNPATELVTGTLTIDQTLPGPSADCSGPHTNFTGTANSDLTSMSGNYTIPSQANGAVCDAGDSGTWSATKTQ